MFGPWQTIWTWHRRLAGDGTWDRVLERLLTAADASGMIDWAVSVDSTIARAHQLVDGHGLPLVVLVAPGQPGDSPAFPYLLAHLQVPRAGGRRRAPAPARIESGARKAYSCRAHRDLLRRLGIGAVIAEPDDQAGHRRRRGSRGGRPPAFDRDDYRGRNVVERRLCHLKQWRGLATRYDKLAIVYRAA
ncbi:IS5/IS1182 family transposase, partial [Rhodococcus oxybenzonivorans]|nr:IS5/IS1182 family transposase [Rhodococcus oxybenzonivorans]